MIFCLEEGGGGRLYGMVDVRCVSSIPERFYKIIALRLDLVGFGSLSD